jgi:hypothetical protein
MRAISVHGVDDHAQPFFEKKRDNQKLGQFIFYLYPVITTEPPRSKLGRVCFFSFL